MQIQSITLKNFRNYEGQTVQFDPHRNIIIGENAQGKTNLVEAVYLCAFARSFRTANTREMIRFGESQASIDARVLSEDIDKRIQILLRSDGKKMLKKDGKILKRASDLLRTIVVVVFSPEDLRIIKDSPDKRRNFLDKEISQLRPGYFESLHRYQEVVRQKNAFLKQIIYKNGGMLSKDSEEEGILDVLDMQLAEYGSKVIRQRREFVKLLNREASAIQQGISGGREELEILCKETVNPDEFYETLLREREKDLRNGSSGPGPHRDDLEFLINGKSAKKFGSQGQQRTIALTLKLAEIRIAKTLLGENAILLLDDVLSELDRERQKYLLQHIDDIQIFITSADADEELLAEVEKGKIFRVENGRLTE